MSSRKNLISIEIEKRAAKEFRELPRRMQERVAEAIDGLCENPLAGLQMSGEFRHFRRLKVGVYRVVYTFKSDKLMVLVLRIGHRKNIYRDLE